MVPAPMARASAHWRRSFPRKTTESSSDMRGFLSEESVGKESGWGGMINPWARSAAQGARRNGG